MPENSNPDRHEHPRRLSLASDPADAVTSPDAPGEAAHGSAPRGSGGSSREYVELRCKSNFSFLRGASHPEELVERAAGLGYPALGIADVETLAGVVRGHCAAKTHGLKLLVGAEIRPADGPDIGLYALDRRGYGRLARLITTGRMRAIKGSCHIMTADILEHAEGLIGIAYGATRQVERYREAFGDRLYLGAAAHCGDNDDQTLAARRRLSRQTRIPLVVVNDVHYHEAERRFLQDVLTCVREGCTLAEAGSRLFPNGERFLKSREQMERVFHAYPDAVARTREVADRCDFSLDELRYEYPPEVCPPGRTPAEHLAELTWAGARRRYGDRVPDKARRLIEHELRLIGELRYEHYFLTVWDLVRYARSRGILCQGRGSAANSAVCYCLGVTSVDPDRIDLLFERFISAERNEPPDIDVDFEHERREEVLQYIYDKYGRERAGIAAEVITFRPKSAVRDVGKALGFSQDRLDVLAKKVEWWSDPRQMTGDLATAGMNPEDHTVRCLIALCRQIIGFPRHLSQHVGGFVITAGPLCELVPIENAAMPDRTFIEWDKDDIDALGILKIDCLALGMLTAIRKAFDLIVASGGDDDPFVRSLKGKDANERLAVVPAEDEAVYDMVCHADTVGVFQVESRAQMSMLPRLRPRNFYDLVIEIAIVRPGPIQGGMVHPYLRRRSGKEAVTYPSEAVRDVLEKTLGVPLFQEQAMRLAVVAAGFTPGEADQLRRSMGAWRRSGSIDKFGVKLIEGMRANGYNDTFAEQLFNQIRGFGEYGFPESHAASFALLVYVSAWLKRYYPAAFAAAVINSQPMGFYAPAQLVRDAREHGVRVSPVDVNHSDYDCTLEGRGVVPAPGSADEPAERWGEKGPALRLGFRLIKGISQSGADGIAVARRSGPFAGMGDLVRRGGAARGVLARLAAADALGSLGLDRRQALWSVLALDDELPLFAGRDSEEPPAHLPEMMLNEQVVGDYETTGLSLKAHPMSLIRPALNAADVLPGKQANAMPQGRRVRVAGLVLVRQRPSTALGIIFMTLEDETGVVNLVVRPKVYERYRAAASGATALVAQGKIEREGEVVHVQVESMASMTTWMAGLKVASRDFH